MSLDKAIAHGKEKRKPYRGSKAIDCTCRNHGSCQWCIENRTHKFRDKESETVRKQITYISDDGEEFATEEECYAYEHRFDDAMNAAIFLDGEFNVIPFDLAKVYDNFIYIVIRDEEKAKDLFWAIHEWENFFELPKGYHDGDLIAWDAEDEKYVDLYAERDRINRKIASIKKAVNSVG